MEIKTTGEIKDIDVGIYEQDTSMLGKNYIKLVGMDKNKLSKKWVVVDDLKRVIEKAKHFVYTETFVELLLEELNEAEDEN